MTSYMKNPGFEDSTKDWINSGFGSQTNTAFNLKVGTYYCEIWGAINDSEIYQYVNLPNGNYRLTVVGQNVQQSNISYYSGLIHLLQNNPSAAKNDFTQALQLYPGNIWAQLMNKDIH